MKNTLELEETVIDNRPTDRDAKYLEILLNRLRVCRNYKPQFGQGDAVSLEQFLDLYHSDSFYSWFGLDTPLIYAAHKAAGGITSIYRQIGKGGEELIRQLLIDELGLTEAQVTWFYSIVSGSKRRTLTLDGRIPLDLITEPQKYQSIRTWLQDAARKLEVAEEISQALKGCVFEVRQGYKSKDSKRQNADIANGLAAFKAGYLPAIMLLSNQIDDDIAARYRQSGLLVLTGQTAGSPLYSTYAFSREVLGYDLAAFFERHSGILRNEIQTIVEALLKPNET